MTKRKLIINARQIISFLDIGTNAVRLAIVRFNNRDKYEIICEKRAPTRLGVGMYSSGRLAPEAINRTVAACKFFCLTSKLLGARKIIAVMTAAGREARNGKTLIKKILASTGIEPVILSEKKEAQLIYSGILNAMNTGRKRILIMEIGGGSTELASGLGRLCKTAMALKIGAVRMKHYYPVIGGKKPVPETVYRQIVAELIISLRPHLMQFIGQRFNLVFGSAGTIRSIANAFARFHGRKLTANNSISFRQVSKTALRLCGLSLSQRKKILKIQPDRADIIIGGAAILEAIMMLLNIRSIRVSHCGLREGLILDAYPTFPSGNRSL